MVFEKKTKVEKLDVGKLESVSKDLKKLSDEVDKVAGKKTRDRWRKFLMPLL